MWSLVTSTISVAVGNVIPHYLLFLLSTILVLTPLDPAKAAQDFTVFRAQQYDYQGVNLGTRASVMNCESQALSSRLGNLEGAQVPKPPVVVICAYYDAMSAIPSLAYGSDANGSGVVALLELARIFSRFYADASTTPKYDLVFLLSGGGKFNFMGTKRWLDQKIEDTTGLAMLDAVTQVLCLEGIGTARFGSDLHVHLSRPPKDGSFSQRLVNSLKLAAQLHPFPLNNTSTESSSVHVVHKKINLNQELLGWEHERFSIHRLPGMTLSSWPSVQVANQWRQTSLDGGPLSHFTGSASKSSRMRGAVDPVVLARNTRVVAEALARVLLDLDMNESAMNTSALIAEEVSCAFRIVILLVYFLSSTSLVI
ncbi:unnamed protein product [Echinostoma caproni]|uniref:BOS complex subunit NCLN n=1 Tax=Echinostoma caproni TaxID=27848 RepID=A0A183AYS9_9TREM|nr:unnamed protein product [Echinostoma caproni]